MARANSTRGRPSGKPYPEFPLSRHATGRWVKKIRGKHYYFAGTWQEALAEYQRVRDDLYAGRKPRPDTDAVTVRYCCNAFLTERQQRVDSGDLSEQMHARYRLCCKRMVKCFGADRRAEDLRPDDFARLRATYSSDWSRNTTGNQIQWTKAIFNFAYQSELIDKPVRYGPSFKRPSNRVVRLHKETTWRANVRIRADTRDAGGLRRDVAGYDSARCQLWIRAGRLCTIDAGESG